ncbi:hypothetical protein OPV22_031267 [Ensete ventricosum]|uniref:Uncharacterized protein n=1 Tax=Ensete ventricosum TaxID=4639 RepID=A0AAV8PKH1_ENSVE|nr:hypothetical protein OPV22_031267 [Ensete ventricosum]RWW04238.1 hypothetical protein GW17_00032550 [Ensete ventricosum]RWW65720.1 hypothetical protein BHE74_00026960 [Ensete ventricosum]
MGRRWWPPARRRACLMLALVCCFPVLIPLACLSFPLLLIAGLCLLVWRRRRKPRGWEGSAILGRCEDEEAAEGRLLHRYLDDQLGLVGAGLLLDCDGGGD